MAIKNSLNFGGVSSAQYGIFISGEGTFNAPQRDIEFIDIPGRNGSLIIDQGHYKNITVEYPIFVPADDQIGFRKKVAEFRNAIASQIGYQRLSDTYHPEEYRLAVFDAGIDVEPVAINTAGRMTLSFNCKPQRFLISGEQSESVSRGSNIINPTQHDSSPLIAVEGYGTINVGDYTIELERVTVGNVEVMKQSGKQSLSGSLSFDNSFYNSGDTITLSGAVVEHGLAGEWGKWDYDHTSVDSESGVSGSASSVARETAWRLWVNTALGDIAFTAGTSGSASHAVSFSGMQTSSLGTRYGVNDYTITVTYTPGTSADTISFSISNTNRGHVNYIADYVSGSVVSADSSQTALGHPTYIDCEIGEVYKVSGDSYISLNAWIDLGSYLPVLVPGENYITFDNTITSFVITPRWWQI